VTADRPAGEPTGVAARIVALRALRRVHAGGAWSVPAVHAELDRVRLDARDRSFAANLAYETLRWEGSLDWALGRVSSRPLDRVDPVVRDILRMGAWQLLYGRLPDRAAVGTAVDVTRAEVGSHVTGFVNGVLRGLARERDRLPWPSERDDAGLGLRLGYPEWMVRAARERFGDRARAVLEAGNAAPGVTLRAVLPGSRDALIAELRDAGVDATAGSRPGSARRVATHPRPSALAVPTPGGCPPSPRAAPSSRTRPPCSSRARPSRLLSSRADPCPSRPGQRR
jgi:16S rRNA (cytosine967-C5)-methyltransferase